MKIVVFSDIHGNKYALSSIIESAKKEGAKRIICLGDVMGIGPDPKGCLELIIENNVEMILGNHELYYMKGTDINEINDGEKAHHVWIKKNLDEKHLNYLKTRPLKIEIDDMLFSHYIINDEKSDYPFYHFDIIENGIMFEMLKNQEYKYSFIGHYHNAFELEYNDKFIVDVGSSGCVSDNTTTYVLIDNGTYQRKSITYDRESFIKELNSVDYPDKEFLQKTFFGVEDK